MSMGTKISIHAPIVGCDRSRTYWWYYSIYFNPRTHRGVRHRPRRSSLQLPLFQSTHPSWGATAHNSRDCKGKCYFNPRTHRGVRRYQSVVILYRVYDFNPRTHRGVRPGASSSLSYSNSYFNPRTHRGVRHCLSRLPHTHKLISIHAPIVGCDRFPHSFLFQPCNFNPRTHRGVRQYHVPLFLLLSQFQSTHPSWGATSLFINLFNRNYISIHAPIVGCDVSLKSTIGPAFYISIHAPIVGCDCFNSISR